jgi:vacuolar protein sorting-associated protein 52
MTRPTLKTKASVFSMGQRAEVLSNELEAPILVPHAFEKAGTKVT